MSYDIYFIVYHSVSDCDFVPKELGLSLSPKRFRSHMKSLRRFYNVISHEHALDILSGDSSPIPRAVVVNFDDGYRDNWENAFPVLKEYGIPATVFLTTGLIGTNKRIWLNELYLDFHRTTIPSLHFSNEYGEHFEYQLSTKEDRRKALFSVRHLLKNAGGPFRSELVDNLKKQLNERVSGYDSNDLKMLSWEQINQMSHFDISFGAHSVNHLILSNESPVVRVLEIRNSKTAIEEKTGKPVDIFAYPGNAGKGFDEQTKSAVLDSGFRACCLFSTGTGFNRIGCDLLEINRAEILGTVFDLHLELLGLRQRISSFRNKQQRKKK